jgi:O-antigen/teichoic acid export membrane protein
MGILAVLQLLIGVCQTFIALAIQPAATRFVAEEISNGHRHAAAAVFYQCLRLTLLLAMPASLILFLGASSLATLFLGDQSYVILFQFLAVDVLVSVGALPVLVGALIGLQKFKETAIVNVVVSNILRQVAIITLVVLLKNFVGLVIGWVISDLAASAVYLVYVLLLLGRPTFEFPLRRLLRFSWPLYFGNVASLAQSWFDRALLVAFVPLATLGVYNATLTAFGVLTGISSAMSTTLLPAYSGMTGQDRKRVLVGASRTASRYVSFLLAPLSLGLLATAKPALILFVGQAYSEGTGPLMILSAIFALTAFTIALGPILLAIEKTWISSAITVLSVLVGVATGVILMPLSGILGASIARGLAMTLSSAVTVIVLKRHIQLQLDFSSILKSLLASTVMATVVFASQIAVYDKLLLPIYVLIGVFVYVLMLRFLKAVKEEDIDLIRELLGERLSFGTRILRRALL